MLSTALNNAVILRLIEQVLNITYLLLTAPRVDDNGVDDFDILSDITSGEIDLILQFWFMLLTWI